MGLSQMSQSGIDELYRKISDAVGLHINYNNPKHTPEDKRKALEQVLEHLHAYGVKR